MNEPAKLDQLVLEIKFYSQQTALNMIEVGKRLIQAKEQVAHGEWGKWLEGNIGYGERRAQQFMKVAEAFAKANSNSLLAPTKVIALLDLPEDQREDFVAQPHVLPSGETKTVDDMTTREFKAAIKAQKEAEQKAESMERRAKKAEAMIEELEQQKPKVITKEIEKPVIPPDYHQLKRRVSEFESSLSNKDDKIKQLQESIGLLERKVKLNEQEAKDYQTLKTSIEQLKNEKTDIARQIKAATELSGLVVRIESFIKEQLAPVKYSRAIQEQHHDKIVQDNLREIINRVRGWCNEMDDLVVINNHEMGVIDIE